MKVTQLVGFDVYAGACCRGSEPRCFVPARGLEYSRSAPDLDVVQRAGRMLTGIRIGLIDCFVQLD